jgi:hypothetical protein
MSDTTRQSKTRADRLRREEPELLEPGFLVALTLRPGAAPLRCYVGEVQHVGIWGIRLTLVDWISGLMTGSDFVVPWSEITAILVGTPEHDIAMFGEDAKRWQTLCGRLGGEPQDDPAEDAAE